jgi:hypothetical protein
MFNSSSVLVKRTMRLIITVEALTDLSTWGRPLDRLTLSRLQHEVTSIRQPSTCLSAFSTSWVLHWTGLLSHQFCIQI